MRLRPVLLALTSLSLLAAPAHAVTLDWVFVGDPGNAPDDTGFGAVDYAYKIGKYEVTNAQYTGFLNAVAATDTFGLWDPDMEHPDFGGIERSGSAGSYSYATRDGFAQKPVNFVSFYDALRFANWMENGQPTGLQDATTTEDGSYTITQAGIDANDIFRNAGARFALTSEDEWYKAAYYDASVLSYYDFPAGSDDQTTCSLPGPGANIANCQFTPPSGPFGPFDITEVGSYPGSASPYGTFDQGGNLLEFTETRQGLGRISRGGAFSADAPALAASARGSVAPTIGRSSQGFRLVLVPEPKTGLLVSAGLLAMGLCRGKAR